MKTLIVAGGPLSADFLTTYRNNLRPDDVIAADRGVDVLREAELVPDVLLGDYDSTELGAHSDFLEDYYQRGAEILTYPPEKDFTDTEAALHEAIKRGSTEIHLLGATGGRLDHFLGSLQNLLIPLNAGVRCVIADEQNRIELLSPKRPLQLRKAEIFGTYVSFLPFGGAVHGLTLRGFRYPLTDADLVPGVSLGVSNEVTEDEAEVSFQDGILIMVQSRDRT